MAAMIGLHLLGEAMTPVAGLRHLGKDNGAHGRTAPLDEGKDAQGRSALAGKDNGALDERHCFIII